MPDRTTPITIGESRTMVAMMVGADPTRIKGFVVIAVHQDDYSEVAHNLHTPAQVAMVLQQKALDILADGDVDRDMYEDQTP